VLGAMLTLASIGLGAIPTFASAAPAEVPTAEGSTAATEAACTGRWEDLHIPRPNGVEGFTATAPDDAWAAVTEEDAGGFDQGFSYHWDGTTWARVPFAEAGFLQFVQGMAGIGPDDVWAVGYWQDAETYQAHPYAAHWDGSRFVHTPIDGGGHSPRLFAVDGAIGDDVWAVGYHYLHGTVRSLAMHWDGLEWSDVETPTPSLAKRFLWDVSAAANDDVWAVGSTRRPGHGRHPLALHWDGVRWTRIQARTPGTSASFDAVHAIAQNDVWAVGSTGHRVRRPLIERWNGTAWSVIPIPDSGRQTWLYDVSAVSAQEAWAVGGKGSPPVPVLWHWNGSAWRSVGVPRATFGYLIDVVSLPTGTSFAFGAVNRGTAVLRRCPAG
jgi:hypothetical protein